MLYRTLKRMIERGSTDGLAEKIDIFYAAGKLTDEHWLDLEPPTFVLWLAVR